MSKVVIVLIRTEFGKQKAILCYDGELFLGVLTILYLKSTQIWMSVIGSKGTCRVFEKTIMIKIISDSITTHFVLSNESLFTTTKNHYISAFK